jgi:hypothetical protein
MNIVRPLLATTLALAAAASQAQALAPTHYDMPNGYGMASGGSFNYWDASYNGTGAATTDYAPLSGGRGDLTDGVIATEGWWLVENVEGTGPYVGWNREEAWVIDFHFGERSRFDSVTLWHDDADGFGDILPPAAVTVVVDGRSQRFELVDQPGSAPYASTLLLGEGWVGQSVQLRIERLSNGLMLSEVGFEGVAAPVPEPSAWALMALGLGAIGLRRRQALTRCAHPGS